MMAAAIELLNNIGVMPAVTAAVTITVAWVLYHRFTDKS